MASRRPHASDTRVPVAQTRGQIDALLRERRCDGVRWTDFWNPTRGVLEFTWTPKEGGALLARLELSVPRAPSRRDVQRWQEQEWRRLHRVLRIFLLGQFEAVDAGLVSLDEAMLPWIVTQKGRTVAQELLPRLRELPASSAVALLEG